MSSSTAQQRIRKAPSCFLFTVDPNSNAGNHHNRVILLRIDCLPWLAERPICFDYDNFMEAQAAWKDLVLEALTIYTSGNTIDVKANMSAMRECGTTEAI